MKTDCVNCCGSGLPNRIVFKGPDNPNPGRVTGQQNVSVAETLNFIFKSSGKRLPYKSNRVVDDVKICRPCWEIVSDLYILHKKLSALTKLNSLLNNTFQLVDIKAHEGSEMPVQPVVVPRPLQASATDVIEDMGFPDSDWDSSIHPEVNEEMRQNSEPVHDLKPDLFAPVNSYASNPLIVTPGPGLILRRMPESGVPSVSNANKPEPQSSVPSSASELFKLQRRLGGTRAPYLQNALLSRHIQKPNTIPESLTLNSASQRPEIATTAPKNRRKQQLTVISQDESKILKPNDRTTSESEPQRLTVISQEESKILKPNDRTASESEPQQLTVISQEKSKTLKPNDRTVAESAPKPKKKYPIKYKHSPCPHCDRVYNRSATLKCHIKNRHGQGTPVTCPECGRVFKWAFSLERHFKVQHEKISNTICPICEKPLSEGRTLRTHLATHENPIERAKEKAKKALENPSSKTPAFLCPECGKTYFSACALKSHHIMAHIPDSEAKEFRKVYKCTEPNCSFTSANPNSLKRHKYARHSQSTYFKFKCSRCSQGFRLKGDLRTHVLSWCDPSERPYQCAHCEKRFKYKQALEWHYKVVHKLGWEEARALVYPGLPLKPSSSDWRSRLTKKKSNKQVEQEVLPAPAPAAVAEAAMDLAFQEYVTDPDRVYLQL